MPLGQLIKEMLRTNTLDYKEGRLEILGIRGLVFPAPTYVRLLENISEETEVDVLQLLFETGREHGRIAVNDVGRQNNTSSKQFVHKVIKTANVMGIGEIQIETYKPGELLVTSIKDSPLNSLFNESNHLNPDEPIHQFWRGAIHSMSAAALDSDIKSEEVKCEYLGDEKCLIRCKAV